MNLSRPMVITFVISLIIALFAFLIAADVISNPLKSVAVVWIALIAYAILAVGNLVKGM
ncbi:MAG: hypothetical protein ABSD62_08430 [Candidatus Limnocylindrales bacterium]|jgi:hypothetical protein